MRDFFYTAQQIGNSNLISAGKSSLVRYFKLENSGFSAQADSSQYNRPSGFWGGVNSAATGMPAPGFLMNQHQPTLGAAMQAGHGFPMVLQWTGGQDVGVDNPLNQSFSLVFAGLKPHDMSVARSWHTFGSGSNIGGELVINTDGSIKVSSNVANPVTSAAGVIKQYVPHLVIVSYDNVAHTLTVYVGDWTGRWVTPISAAGAAISTSAPTGVIGSTKTAGPSAADGFLDDYACFIGHAITSAEAQQLFTASGYSDSALSYNTTPGHRNAPLNRAYPSSQAIESTSTAAVTDFAHYADSSFINGAGSFNYNSFTTSIYIVTKAFRQNSANWIKVNAPTHYGDEAQIMCFEDVPAPFSGRPSLGFIPSNGSDAHMAIWCPQTDEYWEMGAMSNSGTDAAPVWGAQFGMKLNNFSLFMGAGANGLGATATGIPNMLGVPTIKEIQNAIYSGVPIPHGLSAVVYDGKNSQVWPANRHDGGSATLNMIEGQTYRLKHDAATTALIAAMPHPTGRVMAQAAQTYCILVVDRNLFANVLQTEDRAQELNSTGVTSYTTDPVGKPALSGILNGGGSNGSGLAMTGFPWSNLELLDHTQINPADATQSVRPAPSGLSGRHTTGQISLSWPDDPLASSWNVYQNVGGVYTKIASTSWPSYTVWNPASSMKLAITAVNGGGESSRSLDFTPPFPARSRRRSRALVG